MNAAKRGAKGRRWEVVHLDLSEGVEALPRQEGIGGLYIVFWWRGVPLGQRDVPAAELPVTAARLAAVAAEAIAPAVADYLGDRFHGDDGLGSVPGLEALDTALTQRGMGGAEPSVSVVICTLDRPEPLAQCLEALQQQTQPPLEIVVVDNAPTSGATRLCIEGFPGVRYVPEPRKGLSVARNTGIRASTGDLIAFTDDDVAVHPDWLARLGDAFTDPAVNAVTGLVLPAELETEAQRLFEWSHAGWGFRRRRFDAAFFEVAKHKGAPTWSIGAGANMAFRRRVFERLGGFDERLGAGASGCSEDSEMWYRILAEGGTCVYVPAAVVFHYHRREVEALRRQMHAYMRGHVSALFAQFGRYRDRGNLLRVFLTLPRYYARGLIRRIRYGPSDRDQTFLPEISGYVTGLLTCWKYLPNRTFDVGTERRADGASRAGIAGGSNI